MELQQLRYFRALMRHENTVRAAESLKVAQSTLSKSIQQLEEELGVELFERQGRGLRSSEPGRAFLPHVEAAFRELDDGRRRMRDLSGSRYGELVVSALAFHWAAGLFKAYAVQRPRIRLRLLQRTPAEMLQGLARREVDLCLMADPGLESVVWRPLIEGAVCAIVPPDHRLVGRGEVRLEDLRGEPTIVPREGDTLRDLIDAAYREAGVEPNVVCESDDPSAVRELVALGMGVRFVPDLGGIQSAGGDPCLLRLESGPTLRLGRAWARDGYRTQAALDFAAFAEAFVRFAYPPTSPGA